MNDKELTKLEQAIQDIMDIANGFGLTYYPMQYEVCPADIIYTIAAYGMPTRFSHWHSNCRNVSRLSNRYSGTYQSNTIYK